MLSKEEIKRIESRYYNLLVEERVNNFFPEEKIEEFIFLSYELDIYFLEMSKRAERNIPDWNKRIH